MSHLNKYGFGIEADGEPTTVNAEPPATNIPAEKLDETGPTDTTTPVTPMPEGTPTDVPLATTPAEIPAEPMAPNADGSIPTDTTAAAPSEDKTIKIEIQIASESLDKIDDAVATLESIQYELRRSLKNGGISLPARNIANIAVQQAFKDLDYTVKSISNESYSSISNYEATVASLETVGEAIGNAWQAIKDFFAKIWNWIKGLFGGSKTKEDKVADMIKDSQAKCSEALAATTNLARTVDNIKLDPETSAAIDDAVAKFSAPPPTTDYGQALVGAHVGNESFKDKKDKYGFSLEDNSNVIEMPTTHGYIGTSGNLKSGIENLYRWIGAAYTNLTHGLNEETQKLDRAIKDGLTSGKNWEATVNKFSDGFYKVIGDVGKGFKSQPEVNENEITYTSENKDWQILHRLTIPNENNIKPSNYKLQISLLPATDKNELSYKILNLNEIMEVLKIADNTLKILNQNNLGKSLVDNLASLEKSGDQLTQHAPNLAKIGQPGDNGYMTILSKYVGTMVKLSKSTIDIRNECISRLEWTVHLCNKMIEAA